jgi:hypothetical protein
MKIILTENQIEFIRRYKKIKELVDNGIDVIQQEVNWGDEDMCGYTYSEFIEEVCWQVSDKMEDLNMDTETVGTIEKIHKWVRDNFGQHIREEFDRLIDEHNCDEGFDDVDDEDDEDYISGLMYGVDNIQENDNDDDDDDDKYYSSLKTSLIRRHNIIMEEMYHYIDNLIDCDEYPDDVDGFIDHILESVSDAMMYTHNINNWLWADLYDMLNNLIGEQINDYYISWTRKHC